MGVAWRGDTLRSWLELEIHFTNYRPFSSVRKKVYSCQLIGRKEINTVRRLRSTSKMGNLDFPRQMLGFFWRNMIQPSLISEISAKSSGFANSDEKTNIAMATRNSNSHWIIEFRIPNLKWEYFHEMGSLRPLHGKTGCDIWALSSQNVQYLTPFWILSSCLRIFASLWWLVVMKIAWRREGNDESQ